MFYKFVWQPSEYLSGQIAWKLMGFIKCSTFCHISLAAGYDHACVCISSLWEDTKRRYLRCNYFLSGVGLFWPCWGLCVWHINCRVKWNLTRLAPPGELPPDHHLLLTTWRFSCHIIGEGISPVAVQMESDIGFTAKPLLWVRLLLYGPLLQPRD